MSASKNIRIIVIGGSAGSYSVVTKILSSLPEGFTIPVLLCLHRLKEVRNGFVESLNIHSRLPVREPFDKEKIKPGFVYLSPANYHLMVEPGHSFALSVDDNVNYSRPSLDVTFETVGYTYRDKMAGILLSGANSDGAKGLFSAFRYGSYTIVQNPSNASFRTMPAEALKYFKPHMLATDDEIVRFISSLKKNKHD